MCLLTQYFFPRQWNRRGTESLTPPTSGLPRPTMEKGSTVLWLFHSDEGEDEDWICLLREGGSKSKTGRCVRAMRGRGDWHRLTGILKDPWLPQALLLLFQ